MLNGMTRLVRSRGSCAPLAREVPVTPACLITDREASASKAARNLLKTSPTLRLRRSFDDTTLIDSVACAERRGSPRRPGTLKEFLGLAGFAFLLCASWRSDPPANGGQPRARRREASPLEAVAYPAENKRAGFPSPMLRSHNPPHLRQLRKTKGRREEIGGPGGGHGHKT